MRPCYSVIILIFNESKPTTMHFETLPDFPIIAVPLASKPIFILTKDVNLKKLIPKPITLFLNRTKPSPAR